VLAKGKKMGLLKALLLFLRAVPNASAAEIIHDTLVKNAA